MNEDAIIIIPARKGSKRIKNKNLAIINNLYLIEHTIKDAIDCNFTNEIYLTTDCKDLKKLNKKYPINIIHRPNHLSIDTSTSESALIHVLDQRIKDGKKDPKFVIFLQCTSPFRKKNDIDNAIQTLIKSKANSLLSVVEFKRFIWKKNKNRMFSLNYNFQKRKREQDFEGCFQENGSIYITETNFLRKTNNRLCGKIVSYVMEYWSSLQIDEPEDLQIARIISNKYRKKQKLSSLKMIIFDFDGVLTNNKVTLNHNGEESVTCNRSDGLAIEILRKKYKILVLSSEKNKVVEHRCKKLKIKVIHGVKSKVTVLKKVMVKEKIKKSQVLYVGNDINDKECLDYVKYPYVVKDSTREIIQGGYNILESKGGEGVVRELLSIIND